MSSIDVNYPATILNTLSGLQTGAAPRFGIMTPQHMVEHLSSLFLFSNGRGPIGLLVSPEKAAQFKSYLIGTDNEFPRDFDGPIGKGVLLPLKFENLGQAKEAFRKELTNYTDYYTQDPDAQPNHPALGILNKAEWDEFHNKHIRHHFYQFDLIP